MKKSGSKKFVIPAAACLAVILFLCYYFFFTAMTRGEGSRYVYIDEDDNIDSVYAQLDTMSRSHALAGFKTLTRHSSYAEHIRTGRYEIRQGEGAFTPVSIDVTQFSGRKVPVSVTVYPIPKLFPAPQNRSQAAACCKPASSSGALTALPFTIRMTRRRWRFTPSLPLTLPRNPCAMP